MVDPYIRFSWIKKQWERSWILKAEDTVLALVRLNYTFGYQSNSLNVQMKEYRATKVIQPKESQRSHEADPLNALARRYRITDMSIESSTPSGFQDVEQEYRAYIDGDLLNNLQDPLQFWQVRTYFGGSVSQSHSLHS